MLSSHLERNVQSKAGVVAQHGFPAFAIEIDFLIFWIGASFVKDACTELFDGLAETLVVLGRGLKDLC